MPLATEDQAQPTSMRYTLHLAAAPTNDDTTERGDIRRTTDNRARRICVSATLLANLRFPVVSRSETVSFPVLDTLLRQIPTTCFAPAPNSESPR